MKRIGNTSIERRHRLRCHCGAVEIELDLPDGVVDPRRCDCSICRRKGAVMASVPLAALKLLRGEQALRLYQFDTREAEHYFCSVCGIYTHHRRRSNPHQFGYNVGCLVGVDPLLIENVVTNDGINHPSDRAGANDDYIRVFFYGLFMDKRLLLEQGFAPLSPEIARVDGYGLRIGARATLVEARDETVHGMLMSLPQKQLQSLYRGPGLDDYSPQPLTALLPNGQRIAAISYLIADQKLDQHKRDYARQLAKLARELELPSAYVSVIDSWAN